MTRETKIVMCATKEGKLWHIKKDIVHTYCGYLPWDMCTDPIELPKDHRLICPQCLEEIIG